MLPCQIVFSVLLFVTCVSRNGIADALLLATPEATRATTSSKAARRATSREVRRTGLDILLPPRAGQRHPTAGGMSGDRMWHLPLGQASDGAEKVASLFGEPAPTAKSSDVDEGLGGVPG